MVATVVLVGVIRLWPWSDRGATNVAGSSWLKQCLDEGSTQEVEPHWFEDERAIYHEIPARVLFRLPQRSLDRAAVIACKAWEEFDRVGIIFNAFSATSEVSRLNRLGAQGCQRVSSDLSEVLRISQMLWKESQGRFDPTVWPLKELWRSAERSQRVPDRAAIEAALNRMGLSKVEFCKEPNRIRFTRPGIKVEFGAIAKGYAVDRVKALLEAEGVSAGLVQLGGEIACFGEARAKKWRLGVQHPKESEKLWGTIAFQYALGVSTSGNYRQPLQIGDATYYHIFDPTTGLPASNQVLGVTTASFGRRANNALLDGAATAITVLGAEQGLQLARSLGVEALVLKDDGQGNTTEQMTEGFAKVYTRIQSAEGTSEAHGRN